MDYRQLGHSGLRVSALTLGTMTFGGRDRFSLVGDTDVAGATRQIDMCLDRGVNFIDTANVYSAGVCEEILGAGDQGRATRVLLATKARMPMGDGPNDAGLSRHHLIAECENEPAPHAAPTTSTSTRSTSGTARRRSRRRWRRSTRW